MKTVFADSFYFFASFNTREPAHAKAREFSATFVGQFVTTGWVLTELADGLSSPRHRKLFIDLLGDLSSRQDVRVIPCSENLFKRGVDLYSQRSDKDWSLTDCISFVVMQEHNITEALTGDHHFEQAGFIALMK